MDARTLAAGVLGVLLGAVLILAPEVVLRAHTAGRLPPERRGEYGADGPPADRFRWIVRALGVVLVAAGLSFLSTGVL